jgi:hypothetical protein
MSSPMFRIDHLLLGQDHGFGLEHSLPLGTLPWDRLSWSCFMGSVRLEYAEGFISGGNDIVAALDFILDLVWIDDALMTGGQASAQYSFKESDGGITFSKEGDRVSIATSWSDDVLFVGALDFHSAVDEFAKRKTGALVDAYPDLLRNPAFTSNLAPYLKVPGDE